MEKGLQLRAGLYISIWIHMAPNNVRFLQVFVSKCMGLQQIEHQKYLLLHSTEVIRKQEWESAQIDTAQLCSLLYLRHIITLIQQCLRITLGIAQPTSQCTAHQTCPSQQVPWLWLPQALPLTDTAKAFQVQRQSLLQAPPGSFLSSSSHRWYLKPYRDPLWTFKSLPYLDFHSIKCAILFAPLRMKVAGFFSFFPLSDFFFFLPIPNQ